MAAVRRKDQVGEFRTALEKNKKIIYATQSVCAICGQPVDMSLRYPHPLAKSVDHIIPINRGGHPSDLSNLQLAHWTCNRAKADKLLKDPNAAESVVPGKLISNRNLPLARDWSQYRPPEKRDEKSDKSMGA